MVKNNWNMNKLNLMGIIAGMLLFIFASLNIHNNTNSNVFNFVGLIISILIIGWNVYAIKL